MDRDGTTCEFLGRRPRGAAKRKPGDDEERPKAEDESKRPPTPLISATSRIEGIELPKLDYTAPETEPAK